jgi:hypothetical protein
VISGEGCSGFLGSDRGWKRLQKRRQIPETRPAAYRMTPFNPHFTSVRRGAGIKL